MGQLGIPKEANMAVKVLLVGVGCVGKSTIGRVLAERLGFAFFDLDEEIERHFGESIERLHARYLTMHSYRGDASVVLKSIVSQDRDMVVAVAPSGLLDPYWRLLKRVERIAVVVEDTPENILKRIAFFDVNSKPMQKPLTEHEKRSYLKEIRKDITYFRKSYERADLHVDISGLGVAASAEKIERSLEEYAGRRLCAGPTGSAAR
jgi:shikimate kinase